MAKVEKTVFLSYRRTNIGYALAIFQNLTQRGFDVFFDFNSINSGDFSQIILNNIESRVHFVVLLTPSALERINEKDDWLRREIEYAIDTKRNIVPLTMEGFDWKDKTEQLPAKLSVLSSYNALRVPADYFMEAMERLCTRHLNVALDAVIHPRSQLAQNVADEVLEIATVAPEVKENELTAEEWLEKGLLLDDINEAIECYSKAIRLKSDFTYAYNNRGGARTLLGDLEGARADLDLAIKLQPDAIFYNNRGIVRVQQGDIIGALADYKRAILLNSDYAEAYNNRGSVLANFGDFDAAIEAFNHALILKPDHTTSYYNRGIARHEKGDLKGAIEDFDKSIELQPDDAKLYNSRGSSRQANGDLKGAIEDFDKSIELQSDNANAYNNRAWTKYLQHNYSEALIDVSKSLKLHLQDAYAFHTRGAIHLALNDISSAIADFKKAVEIDPDLQDAKDDLEKARAKLK